MTEWWTYSPADFLLFSPRVYYRLFELHNEAVWPAQVLTLGLGLVVLLFALRGTPSASRWTTAILGALWICVVVSLGAVRHDQLDHDIRGAGVRRARIASHLVRRYPRSA